MALTTPLPEVPESRLKFGVGVEQCSFLIVPGTSDYPTGGYLITALQCRLSKIFSVSIDGINSAGNALGFIFTPVLAMTLATNNIPNDVTQFNLFGSNIVASVITQLANGTNLSGLIMVLTVTGY